MAGAFKQQASASEMTRAAAAGNVQPESAAPATAPKTGE
jgi:hypothetical protein